jgi:hypothetical protein
MKMDIYDDAMSFLNADLGLFPLLDCMPLMIQVRMMK